jgi:hypothetical protein
VGRLILVGIVLLAAKADKPALAVRIYPAVSIANIGTGCAPVRLTAEIRGPEDEKWYCPRVDWVWPDGTTSSTESDCPPFERRHECLEPQTDCGSKGWRRNPITGEIEDIMKDCPCTIIGYPRRWSQNVCAPAHPDGGSWVVNVRLLRAGKLFAQENVSFIVR